MTRPKLSYLFTCWAVLFILLFAPSNVCAQHKGFTFLGIPWQTDPSVLVSFDPFAGKVLKTSSVALPLDIFRGLAYDGHHRLYALTTSRRLFSINLSNGSVAQIASLDLTPFFHNGYGGDMGGGLTYVPSTGLLYMTFCTFIDSWPEPNYHFKAQLIQINPRNGQVAKVADLTDGIVDGFIWEPESRTFLGWTTTAQYQAASLFRFDPTTGITNIIFDPPHSVVGLAKSPHPGKYISWGNCTSNRCYFVEFDPVARTMTTLGEFNFNIEEAMALVPGNPLSKKKLTR